MTQTSNLPDETTNPNNLAVLVYRVGEVAGVVKDIDEKIDRMPEAFVTRREWVNRNATVDEKIADTRSNLGAEIGRLRRAVENASSSAKSTIAILISAGGVVVAAIALIFK